MGDYLVGDAEADDFDLVGEVLFFEELEDGGAEAAGEVGVFDGDDEL